MALSPDTTCIQIQEDDRPAFIIGNPECMQSQAAQQAVRESGGNPGAICVGQMSNGEPTSCFLNKPDLHTMAKEEKNIEAVSVLDLVMKLAGSGMQSLQEHAAGMVEKTKRIASKVALFAAIASAGLLAGTSIGAIPYAFEQKDTPQIAEQVAQKSSHDRTDMVEKLAALHIEPPSYDKFTSPVTENLRSRILAMSEKESGQALNATGFDVDAFIEARNVKYIRDNKEDWTTDGKALQDLYLDIQKSDREVKNIMRSMTSEEIAVVLAKETAGQRTGHPLVARIAEVQKLREWTGMGGENALSYPAVLHILSPDGKTLNLSPAQNTILATRQTPLMETEDQRQAYYAKRVDHPEDVLTLVPTIKMLKQLAIDPRPDTQQQIFTDYKAAELKSRFNQSIDFAVKMNDPNRVWGCVAMFSKNLDEIEKVFTSPLYAGLDTKKNTLDSAWRMGQRQMGPLGMDGLSSEEMLSLLSNFDLTPVKEMAEAQRKFQQQQEVAYNIAKMSPEERQQRKAALTERLEEVQQKIQKIETSMLTESKASPVAKMH